MINKEFVKRLKRVFENQTMADVARRLHLPHATVRNYYQGRLPAPEVLVKIANETSVSLTWLLTGVGDIYDGRLPPISLGMLLDAKINEMIEQKLAERFAAEHGGEEVEVKEFDAEEAVRRLDDPQKVMGEWFKFEGRKYREEYGAPFFRGWKTFAVADKIDAIHDAKQLIDRLFV